MLESVFGLILGASIFTIPWYPFVRKQFGSLSQKAYLICINLLVAICSTSIIGHFILLFGVFTWQFAALVNLLFALLFFITFKNNQTWILTEKKLGERWHKWALGITLISIIIRLNEIITNLVPKSFDTFIHIRITSRILENLRPLESSLYYPLGMHGWMISWSTFADWREVLLLSPVIGTILWSVFAWFLICRLNLPDTHKVMLIAMLNFTPFNPIAQHLAWSELPIPRIFVYSMFFFLMALILEPLRNRGSIVIPAVLLIGISFIHNLSALNFSLFIFVWIFTKIWQENGTKNLLIGLKSESILVALVFLTPILVGAIALHSNSISFDPPSDENSENSDLSINILEQGSGFSISGDETHYALDPKLNWTSDDEIPSTVKIIFSEITEGRTSTNQELDIICSGPDELKIGDGKSSYSGIIEVTCLITNPSQNMTLLFDTIEYDDVYDAEGLPPQATLRIDESIPVSVVVSESKLISIPVEAKSLPPDGSWSLRLNWGVGETNVSINTGSYLSEVNSNKSSLDLVIGFLSIKPNNDFLKDNVWWITILSVMLIFVACFSNQEIEIKSFAYSGIAMNFCLITGWLTYPAEWGVVRLAHMQVIPMAIAFIICGWKIYELIADKIPEKYDDKNAIAIIFIAVLVIFGGHESYDSKISQDAWDGAINAEPGHYYVLQNEGWLNYVDPHAITFSSSEPFVNNWGTLSNSSVDERCFPTDIELLIENNLDGNILSDWFEQSNSRNGDRWILSDEGDGYAFWQFNSSDIEGLINISYTDDVLISWSSYDEYSNIILVESGTSYDSATFHTNVNGGGVSPVPGFQYWFCAPDDYIISPIFSFN